MAATRIDINQFLELTRQHPVLDVRSPGEYNHAHLPNAFSLPLFTDEERKVVGTGTQTDSSNEVLNPGLVTPLTLPKICFVTAGSEDSA